MTHRVFDTFSPDEDDALSLFISWVSEKRIIVFPIKDEETIEQSTQELVSIFGFWAMLAINSVIVISEGYEISPEYTS